MNPKHVERIATELSIGAHQVQATLTLFSEGATVPFIARYRKEVTGMLDEVQIMAVRDRMATMVEVDDRRTTIIGSLVERNLLTDTLSTQLHAAESLTRLEDLYQPYRPKRRTRAMMARERGLEPLAQYLFENQSAAYPGNLSDYVSVEKEVESFEAALAGARDIIAEWVSDDPHTRQQVRKIYEEESILSSEVVPGKEAEAAKFRDYFKWQEPLSKAPSHRVLAIRRGEKEGFLMLTIQPESDRVISCLKHIHLKAAGACGLQVADALVDSYKRLLGPSLETEIRLLSKKKADAGAIEIFASNMRELLLSAPLGQKKVLAIDPGFRTGCKVVCLDAQGKLLFDTVIYPGQSTRKEEEGTLILKTLCREYGIEAIAIGNGTASRETEQFVKSCGLPKEIAVIRVDESGASIYSASEVAREEFPDKDITVRGSVSIGRRLMDPLAELVKIDPKSIGVGQYQHDVDQRQLKQSLDDVVISCVNQVGVEVNTASVQLLSYVSGLNERIARNLVSFREAQGPLKSRKDLLKVPSLGPKTFEQAAGFLRVRDGAHPLDGSAVHPESYPVVEQMAFDVGCSVSELLKNNAFRQKIELKRYVTEKTGLPTLQDILQELAKPGRDPRAQFENVEFSESVHTLADLKVGMKLPGVVTNVAAFGAFVDVGVHQDGLVHVSELSDSFVKNPADVVKPQQRVTVTVMEVDLDRKRVALSMKSQPQLRTTGAPQVNRPTEQRRDFNSRSASTPPPRREQAPEKLNTDWFSQAIKKK
jgi:uncharacterized protein